MKKIFTLLTAALMVASCSKSDEPIDPASEKSEAYAAIIDNYLSSTVCPTYRLLADEAEQLVTDLKALQGDKSDARVQTACATFLRARAWWEKSEAFLFGAAADFGIDPHIDSWPLDRDGLVNEMRNASHIAAMGGEDGDEWAGTHLGPELLGFHGIEYIIFANGAPKAVSAIPDNELIYAIAEAKAKVSAMKAHFVLNYTDASATEAMEAMRELTDILTLCKNSL